MSTPTAICPKRLSSFKKLTGWPDSSSSSGAVPGMFLMAESFKLVMQVQRYRTAIMHSGSGALQQCNARQGLSWMANMLVHSCKHACQRSTATKGWHPTLAWPLHNSRAVSMLLATPLAAAALPEQKHVL
jgi:hypothetical protein